MILKVATFLTTLLFSLVSFARPELVIPEEVEISQREELRLGDIVTVSGAEPQLLDVLDKIILRKDARELLLSQKLPSSEVLKIIKDEMKANKDLRQFRPALKVPAQVKVQFSSTPISRQEVERKALNRLRASCHDCEFKVNVQSTPYPTGRKWKVDYSQISPKASILLPVRDGDSRSQKWISGTIRTSKLTPVATRMILQGERLQESDVRMAMVDVTFAKDSGIDSKNLQGQIAVRSIPVDHPIWTSDLKREPATVRGQIVKALIGNDSFEISMNLQAEENGFIGDTIRLRNMDTKKLLSGVIVEKGVVKLQ